MHKDRGRNQEVIEFNKKFADSIKWTCFLFLVYIIVFNI